MIQTTEMKAIHVRKALVELIEKYADSAEENMRLVNLLNELSVLHFPPLVEAIQAIYKQKQYEKFRSKNLSSIWTSVFNRVLNPASRASEDGFIERTKRYELALEIHLFKQFEALVSDLEFETELREFDEIEHLRNSLWLASLKWALEKAKLDTNDEHAYRVLIETSKHLGDVLERESNRFFDDWRNILAEDLRDLRWGGGALELSNAQEAIEYGLLSNLQGLSRLKVSGLGALAYFQANQKEINGLSQVKKLELDRVSDDELLALDSDDLIELVLKGCEHSPIRFHNLPIEFVERLNERFKNEQVAQRIEIAKRLNLVVFKIKFLHIPAGEFWMGSNGGDYYVRLRHKVKISRPFLMGQTAVTQAQWQAVMGENPSVFKGEQRPVEKVSWFDCVRFCNALSEAEGLNPVYRIGSGDKPNVECDLRQHGYRLPTEAEWEYSAKAGTELTYAGSENLDEVAWYYDNSDWETHDVGQKKANAWGLYDLSGNVREWCSDEWNSGAYKKRSGTKTDPHEFSLGASERANRGGSWNRGAGNCEVSNRYWDSPGSRKPRPRPASFQVLE